jgi:excisionase family DNA binding protein
VILEKQQYKYQELAVLLDIPLNTLYQLRKEGRGPKTQVIGRHFRVSKADLEVWLEESKHSND